MDNKKTTDSTIDSTIKDGIIIDKELEDISERISLIQKNPDMPERIKELESIDQRISMLQYTARQKMHESAKNHLNPSEMLEYARRALRASGLIYDHAQLAPGNLEMDINRAPGFFLTELEHQAGVICGPAAGRFSVFFLGDKEIELKFAARILTRQYGRYLYSIFGGESNVAHINSLVHNGLRVPREKFEFPQADKDKYYNMDLRLFAGIVATGSERLIVDRWYIKKPALGCDILIGHWRQKNNMVVFENDVERDYVVQELSFRGDFSVLTSDLNNPSKLFHVIPDEETAIILIEGFYKHLVEAGSVKR